MAFLFIGNYLRAKELSSKANISHEIALMRIRHVRNGHPYSEKNRVIDKLTTEHHPHSNESHIFTVNVIECNCGLVWLDSGLESRKP